MASVIPPVHQALAGFALGVASHLFYFKHGEHHRSAPRLSALLLLSIGLLPIIEAGGWRDVDRNSIRRAAIPFLGFLVGLTSSMMVYRFFYHPLREFPGPRLARASKFWHVWQNRRSQNHLTLHKLHEEYGDFVRIGPSEIAIFIPEGLHAIDGPGNQCEKAEWYDILFPLESVILVRDKPEHDQRRRVWDNAYNSKALGQYEFRIKRHAESLQQWLLAREGQSICVNEPFYWYAFEIVGDLAFGRPFNLFQTGKLHHAVEKMHAFMAMLGPFSAVPWLCLIAISIPGLRSPWTNFMKWCGGEMQTRIDNRAEFDESDTAAKLIAHSLKAGRLKQDTRWLYGDAITMVVAGSDSVGQVLTWIMYYLATQPVYQDAVRKEISETNTSNLELLSNQPTINSIITEVLRLHNVVPTGGVRKTGSKSIIINGKVIPPHTGIAVSRYTISRRADAFEQPNDFVPERWTTKPWMIKNKSAYSPFCTGRYSCPGKGIAYRELACALAAILPQMTVKLAPGESGKRIGDELRDCFSSAPGPLNIVFHKRVE